MAKDDERLYICKSWERCTLANTRGSRRPRPDCEHAGLHMLAGNCYLPCSSVGGVQNAVCRIATDEEQVFHTLAGGE